MGKHIAESSMSLAKPSFCRPKNIMTRTYYKKILRKTNLRLNIVHVSLLQTIARLFGAWNARHM